MPKAKNLYINKGVSNKRSTLSTKILKQQALMAIKARGEEIKNLNVQPCLDYLKTIKI